MKTEQGLESRFVNGIAWNSEGLSGAARGPGKLRIPADERGAARLEAAGKAALRFFCCWRLTPGKDRALIRGGSE